MLVLEVIGLPVVEIRSKQRNALECFHGSDRVPGYTGNQIYEVLMDLKQKRREMA